MRRDFIKRGIAYNDGYEGGFNTAIVYGKRSGKYGAIGKAR
jgi:hypothetical protein